MGDTICVHPCPPMSTHVHPRPPTSTHVHPRPPNKINAIWVDMGGHGWTYTNPKRICTPMYTHVHPCPPTKMIILKLCTLMSTHVHPRSITSTHKKNQFATMGTHVHPPINHLYTTSSHIYIPKNFYGNIYSSKMH